MPSTCMDGLMQKRHNSSALAIDFEGEMYMYEAFLPYVYFWCVFKLIQMAFGCMDGLMQTRHNSSALAIELYVSFAWSKLYAMKVTT